MAETFLATKRRLKLLLVVDSLSIGGAETHVSHVAATMRRRGHSVTVACSQGGPLTVDLEAAGVTVQILQKRIAKRRVSLSYSLRLRQVNLLGQFDLVHAHLFASSAAGVLATLNCPTPLVVTEHSLGVWQGPAARRVSRCILHEAAHVIAVSSSIRSRITDEFGVCAARVSLIPNAVPKVVDGSDLQCACAFDAFPERPLVGVVARLTPEKGVQVFLNAMSAVRCVVPGAQFIVVGDGPLRRELRMLASRSESSQHVRFLGEIMDVHRIMKALDVLVVPSLTDGTPLVILEAMHAGVPIVATRVGGIPEMLRDGREALLVKPGSSHALGGAIVQLLTHRAQAQRLVRASSERADREFDYESMLGHIESVYGSVLAAKYGELRRIHLPLAISRRRGRAVLPPED